MNNYFTLIYLAKELNAILAKAIFLHAVTYKKNTLDLFFAKDTEEIKLSVSVDSVKTACFVDPRVSSRKSNSASFFESLQGAKVDLVEIADGDRFIFIRFSNNGFVLQLRLFGHEPNVFLIREGIIKESFKSPATHEGKPMLQPSGARMKPFDETSGNLKKRIQQSFPLTPRNFIADLISSGSLEEQDDEFINRFLASAEKQLLEKPQPALLADGRFTIFSDQFIDRDGSESFSSVNDAIRIGFYTEAKENRHEKRLKELTQKAEKLFNKYDGIITAGDDAHKSLERAERYEQLGNILVAHAHMKPEGSDNITLPDFYDNNKPVDIPLDPSEDIAANAQNYFDKKKKSERSYESAVAYRETTLLRKAELETIITDLNKTEHLREIEEIQKKFGAHELFQSSGNTKNDLQKPYKVLQQGKYDIWIGKNAKSNDVVLRESHKDDIWLHASGVSGSHVVIRMNKAQADPDMKLIEKAASWAAWMSKGKGSKLCPVKWTRRKFVRKPKGAPAGSVLVDKENIILVEPEEPPKNDFST